ncbi:MAG: SDR family oxidoreductase [Xanthomarina sp.]
MTFKNKVIWITGASSGIGKGLAMQLSKQDCKLILSSRRPEKLLEVKQACHNSENIEILAFDLAHYTQMKHVCETAINFFGRVDILINNGGVSQRSPIIETSIEVDKALMEIDYFGTVALSKALLPHFVANQAGHYVVVSSVMGKFSSLFRSAYCAAKHALHGFFDALRLEHDKDHIMVTIICPGFVNTNVARNALTADGNKQGYQDDMTENGLEIAVFVKRMLKAVEKEKFEVYIGKKEVLGVYLKRFFPKLLHRFVLKSTVQ